MSLRTLSASGLYKPRAIMECLGKEDDQMGKFALFDTYKTVVKNAKDISGYVSESIRNIYGVIVVVDLEKYEGMTSKDIVREVLLEYGIDEPEIDARLDRIMEDFPYSYHDVAWSDTILVMDGSKELIEELQKAGVIIGTVAGEAERVAKMRLQQAGIDGYFRFGAYGEAGIEIVDIIDTAINNASIEFGISREDGVVIGSSPKLVSAGRSSGIYTIGVTNGGFSAEQLKGAGADLVIRSLREKQMILRALKF